MYVIALKVVKPALAMPKVRIGADPGKKGFFTVFIDGELFFEPVPLIGKEVDLHEMNKYLSNFANKDLDVHCVIEDLHAIYGSGAGSTFSFGFVCGALEALLIGNKIPYTKVLPKTWQKEMWVGVPIQKKPSTTGKTMINDTKLMSKMAAKRLFPNVDFRASNRCKIDHDGKIDSLLIAEYCRRNF